MYVIFPLEIPHIQYRVTNIFVVGGGVFKVITFPHFGNITNVYKYDLLTI